MLNGVAALGITIPKRAPAVAIKSVVDVFNERQARAVIPTRALTHPTISKDARALQILGIICAHAKPSGHTEVGQHRIAELAGVVQQTVSYTLKKLVAAGLIEIPHKRPTGRPDSYPLNVMRVIYAPGIDSNAAQSISSNPTNTNPRVSAMHTKLTIGARRIGNKTIPIPDRINGSHSTNLDALTSTNPTIGQNCELLKPSHQLVIESPEQAIRLWIAYAWKHGQHEPIANEDDLAIAHCLVDRHITAQQLETAVLPDPEAAHLRPLVRHLL